MKKTVLFSITLLLCLSLSACGKKPKYRDTVPCETLTGICEEIAVADGGYARYENSYLDYFFESTTLPDHYSLIYSVASADINEIGIFHVPDTESIDKMRSLCEAYLTDMRETQSAFIESYAPRELIKLTNASVHIYGNYVVYLILDEADTKAITARIQKELSE